MVGRKEHVQSIERDGLRVEGVTNMAVRPRVATALRAGERATMVILTVKTYDTEEACRTIARAMSSRP
ncbi:protein containing Ketopantoate reductase ApbA/PanE, partial [mine drainage metagenome]